MEGNRVGGGIVNPDCPFFGVIHRFFSNQPAECCILYGSS